MVQPPVPAVVPMQAAGEAEVVVVSGRADGDVVAVWWVASDLWRKQRLLMSAQLATTNEARLHPKMMTLPVPLFYCQPWPTSCEYLARAGWEEGYPGRIANRDSTPCHNHLNLLAQRKNHQGSQATIPHHTWRNGTWSAAGFLLLMLE